MAAAGKEHLLTALLYPGAGHLIEPPYSPVFRVSKFSKNSKLCSFSGQLGGQMPTYAEMDDFDISSHQIDGNEQLQQVACVCYRVSL